MNRKINNLGYQVSEIERMKLEKKFEKEVKNEVKDVNLNSVRLCFQAYCKSEPDNIICDPVFSDIINNLKSAVSSDLKICRLSRSSGFCRGGDDMILLCEKVKKEDIKIRFYESDENQVIWEDYGKFSVTDVHHQVAIAFKTPGYKENCEKTVFIQLCRDDGAESEPVKFTYIPDDEILNIPKKRKKGEIVEYTHSPNFSQETSLSSTLSPSTSESSLQQLLPLVPENDQQSATDINFEDILSDHDFDLLNLSTAEQYGQDTLQSLYCEVLNETSCDLFGESNIEQQNPSDVVMDSLIQKASSVTISSEKEDHGSSKAHMKLTEKISSSANNKKAFLRDIIKSIFVYGNLKPLFQYAHFIMPMQDKEGNTLLHLMAIHQKKRQELIRKLLDFAPQSCINQRNVHGETALHVATHHNNYNALKTFLIYGGNPALRNKKGNTCFHVAGKRNCVEVMKVLSDHITDRDRSSPLNSLNYDGLSPLHTAVMSNSKSCIKLLLEAGADINVQDAKQGRSPLHHAVEFQPLLVPLLLSWPTVEVNAVDYQGYTALCLAAANNLIDAVRQLLNAGGDPYLEKVSEDSNTEERTAIDCAEGNIEILNLLRNSKSDSCRTVTDVCLTKNYSTQNAEDCNDSGFISDEIYLDPQIIKQLCSLMDPPSSKWKDFGLYIMEPSELETISKLDSKTSPTLTLLQFLQREHGKDSLMIIRQAMEMADFSDALKILNCEI